MQGCKLLLINLITVKYSDEWKKVSHKKITQSRKDAKGKIINDFSSLRTF